MRSLMIDIMSCFVTAMTGVVIIVGLSLDCNLSTLGGPYIESTLLLMLYMLLFINKGYQIGLISIEETATRSTLTDEVFINDRQAPYIKGLIFTDSSDKLPKLFIGHSCISVFYMTLISQLTTFKSFPSVPFFSEQITSLVIRSGLAGIYIHYQCVSITTKAYRSDVSSPFLESCSIRPHGGYCSTSNRVHRSC